MKLSCYRVKNLSYIIIDDFFSEEELAQVLQEVVDVKRFSLHGIESATNHVGQSLRSGKSVWLDQLYSENRNASAILQANRKLFSEEITEHAESFDVVFGFIKKSNRDSTLLNYYGSEQEYKPHHDETRISAVTFLEIGKFTGGEFYFPEQNEVIACKHNRTVVFPSCATHAALPIQGEGIRVSIAQFVDSDPVKK